MSIPPVSPFLSSPLTDIMGTLFTHQNYGPCRDFEMKLFNCFEAYGADRGVTKCADLIADFDECNTRTMQNARIIEMREERFRQYGAGERSKENLYAPAPAPDSYIGE